MNFYGPPTVECSQCNASGVVESMDFHGNYYSEPCDACYGSGLVYIDDADEEGK
jgi:DnaJ-class molecular chaperone